MTIASQHIYESLQEMQSFDLDMETRVFIEEQLFPPEWFTGNEKIESQFKFWLLIKFVQ